MTRSTMGALPARRSTPATRRILRALLVLVALMLVAVGLAIAPPRAGRAEAAGAGYWHTSGTAIVDSANQPVRIAGVNWFGFETANFAPHGLWTRDYRAMMDQMKATGLQHDPPAVLQPAVRRRQHAERHRLRRGRTPTCRADRPADHGQDRRLRRHDRPADHPRPAPAGRRRASPSCGTRPSIPKRAGSRDWAMLARRYAGNPTVIGADLHNEPHGAACWGGGDTARRLAAGRRAGRQRDPGRQPELADLRRGRREAVRHRTRLVGRQPVRRRRSSRCG